MFYPLAECIGLGNSQREHLIEEIIKLTTADATSFAEKVAQLPPVPLTRDNDKGYRDVVIKEDETPLAPVTVKTFVVYNRGPLKGISLYKKGLQGAPDVAIVRFPMVAQLEMVNDYLRPYGYELIVLDAFRSIRVQRLLFTDMFEKVFGKPYSPGMDVAELFLAGLTADDTASFANVLEDEEFYDTVASVIDEIRNNVDFAKACETRGKSIEEGAQDVVIFRKNLSPDEYPSLQFDKVKNTAHGSGASVDVWLVKLDGTPAKMGVPFDYAYVEGKFESGMFGFFDTEGAFDRYRREVAANPVLQEYRRQLDLPEEVTDEECLEIQFIRRLLYYVLRKFGFTLFWLECWHANIKGSPCSEVIEARELDPDVQGKDLTAVFGCEFAHGMAATEFNYN